MIKKAGHVQLFGSVFGDCYEGSPNEVEIIANKSTGDDSQNVNSSMMVVEADQVDYIKEIHGNLYIPSSCTCSTPETTTPESHEDVNIFKDFNIRRRSGRPTKRDQLAKAAYSTTPITSFFKKVP
uniref:Uncharacterized protein n=1 Tax=Panagrolaimus sp. ES5 TaxID=591445 RepID=A0AC34FEU5_9BILA